MARILVTEKVAQAGLNMLQNRGHEVDMRLDMTPEQLVETIGTYDALIVRSATRVTREVVQAGVNLKIIGRAGVIVDNIDVEAATEAGIIVCNAPQSNIISTAEHTFALLLAAARQVPAADRSMKEGRWGRSDFLGVELYEKTLVVFGLGRVGALVAERARAFGMSVVGVDPYCSPERAESLGVVLMKDMDEALALADFITVHLPRTDDTYHLFGPNEFARMKDGVILVNAARGGIFDEKALADFIAAGKVAACGIDMWEEEPCLASPLHEFDCAVLSPHLGASTREAQLRASVQIAQYVAAGLEGSIVPTAVNLAPVPAEVLDAVGPYVPACQVMGAAIAQIKPEIPARLDVVASGTLASADLSVLAAGALDGLLSYRKAGKVTAVNAESVAKRHGIDVVTRSSAAAGEYAATVTMRADEVEVSCTVATAGQKPRITSLLGYKIDIMPQANSLIFEYVDAPGRIGVIGTILGEEGINITTMQIGTKPEEACALVYINVEQEVPDRVVERLRGAIDLKNLWNIKL